MPPDDQDALANYNAMQAAAGLMPPFAAVAPPVALPGQISSQFLQGGMGFAQPMPTYAGGPMMMPGPNGVLMPMNPGGPNQAFGPGVGGMGPMTPPSIFTGYGQTPAPPMYRGPMGTVPGFIAPAAPPAFFNTPFQAGYQQTEAGEMRNFATVMGGVGIAGRGLADLGGAGAGAALGARFGGARGAIAGGVLGFLGSEFGGLGQAGQNFMMNNVAAPAINMRGFGAGIESLSQGFVAGGAYGSVTGAGFSRGASIQTARMLEDMSNSDGFRRETFNRFNTADVMKITQGSAQTGMLQGVQSPEQMRDRVREIAKSLQSFMELANEPDVQRAINTMGNMRMQGMNLSETMQAVQNGRVFARMAGTSFEQIANVGGGQGAATFGSMGLSQGLGARVGMANMGLAGSSANVGTVGAATMNMLGGVQGMANLNNMFSANVLQLPMLAPGMMNAQGGLSATNLQMLAQGRVDPMSMTGMGANNLTAMTQRMGIGGLGMAVGMQPVLQDAIGRMMQAQGPFAQRTMEDRQVMGLARRMGLHGSEGFMTAAQMMGMSGTQAFARAQEMSDPRFFERMRDQIEVRRQERRGVEEREIRANEPGILDTLSEASGTIYGARRGVRNIGRGVRSIYESIAGGGPAAVYEPGTASEARRMRDLIGSRDYARHLDDLGAGPGGERSLYDRVSSGRLLAETRGGRGLASGIAGLMIGLGSSDRELESQLRDVRETGRFTAGMLNSSAREQTAAMRSLGTTFGGSNDALRAFQTNVANLYNNQGGPMGGTIGAGIANTVFRGGAGFLSRGLLDPGNVVGTRGTGFNDLRDAYVGAMQGRSNLSRDELIRQFDANRSEIAMQAAPGAMLRMSDADFARFRRENLDSARATATPESREAREREAYAGILGGEAGNTRSRRAFDSIAGAFGDGFGRNAQQRERSRTLMTTMAILQRQLSDPNRREQAQRQLNAVEAEAERQGVDVREAQRRVVGARDRLSNTDLTDAAASMNMSGTGAEVLGRVGTAVQRRDMAAADQTIGAGFQQLGRSRGLLGRLFSGVNASGEGMNQLRSNIAGMGEDQIAELAEQDPAMARLVQRYNSAGSDREREQVMGQIRQTAYSQGQRVNRQVRRAQEMGVTGRIRAGFNRGHGLFGTISSTVGAAFQSAEDFAAEQMGGGTRADDAAMRESRDVDALEGQARGAGMGTASDRLLEAARSLENAARQFNTGAQADSLDNMIGDQR